MLAAIRGVPGIENMDLTGEFRIVHVAFTEYLDVGKGLEILPTKPWTSGISRAQMALFILPNKLASTAAVDASASPTSGTGIGTSMAPDVHRVLLCCRTRHSEGPGLHHAGAVCLSIRPEVYPELSAACGRG